VDATYRIQGASGIVDPAAASFTPALPNPTSGGTTLMVWVAMSVGNVTVPVADPPWVTDAVASSRLCVLRRPDQPAGETSWPMTAATASRWAWRAEEWAGWSFITQPDAVASNVAIDIGVQANNVAVAPATPPTADVADFAGLAVFHVSGGTGIWPLRTYSAGWNEVDVQTIGDGTGGGPDLQFMVAETYPGVTGLIDCTMTWDTSNGGTYTEKTVNTWSACYQPDMRYTCGALA